nr:immunoglobulin light chain junction region [Macaca mulatta]MOW10804.1 immunoglobulin light chain junction region [Macaca mulatta]MOW14664.1 immunoglobulin light chain junction region [Macaca mulatta]
CLQYYSDPLTF